MHRRLTLALLSAALLLGGTTGFAAVFLRQTSLPPSGARAQLWSVGLTGEERFAGLTEPMMASSTIFFWSAGVFGVGVLLLAYLLLTRMRAHAG